MARNSNNYYYDSFYSLMDFPCQGAETLDDIIEHISDKDLNDRLMEIHAIEHNGDVAKYAVMKKLVDEFITPIEREDIVALIARIDDIMDAIEDVVRLLSMYNIKKIRREAFEFTPVIAESCNVLRVTLAEFKNFRKSKVLKECFVKINELEERGDVIHYESIRNLFKESNNPIEVFTWTNIFEALENCCDACKEVSELVEMIMMKNS